MTAELDNFVLFVNDELLAAGYAAAAHSAGNDRCMRCHTAAGCKDTLSSLHAFDILRGCLKADKDDLLASLCPFLCLVSCEDDLAGSSARCSRKALADLLCLLDSVLVEGAVKKCVKVTRIDRKNSGLLVDLALFYEVIGDLKSSACCSLAVTCLQHVELAVLDRELHILHVTIVIFQLSHQSP